MIHCSSILMMLIILHAGFFRWMVGHFYPELIKSTIKLENDRKIEISKVQYLIDLGYNIALKKFENESEYKRYLIESRVLEEVNLTSNTVRTRLLKPDYFRRAKFIDFVMQDVRYEEVDNKNGLSAYSGAYPFTFR